VLTDVFDPIVDAWENGEQPVVADAELSDGISGIFDYLYMNLGPHIGEMGGPFYPLLRKGIQSAYIRAHAERGVSVGRVEVTFEVSDDGLVPTKAIEAALRAGEPVTQEEVDALFWSGRISQEQLVPLKLEHSFTETLSHDADERAEAEYKRRYQEFQEQVKARREADALDTETGGSTGSGFPDHVQTVLDVIDGLTEAKSAPPHEAVVASVAAFEEITHDEATEWVREALMNGGCYQTADGELKTI